MGGFVGLLCGYGVSLLWKASRCSGWVAGEVSCFTISKCDKDAGIGSAEIIRVSIVAETGRWTENHPVEPKVIAQTEARDSNCGIHTKVLKENRFRLTRSIYPPIWQILH